jgi:hypothetical protein
MAAVDGFKAIATPGLIGENVASSGEERGAS